MRDDQQLAILDGATGTVRWRRRVDDVVGTSFTADGALVVLTRGGAIALDAATGEPRATWCGAGFGLHDLPPPARNVAIPARSVCAD